MPTRYGAQANAKVKRAMHERKEGTLRSGSSGKTVTSRKQAIAIGLSEARRAGGKVPPPKAKGGRRRTRAKKKQRYSGLKGVVRASQQQSATFHDLTAD